MVISIHGPMRNDAVGGFDAAGTLVPRLIEVPIDHDPDCKLSTLSFASIERNTTYMKFDVPGGTLLSSKGSTAVLKQLGAIEPEVFQNPQVLLYFTATVQKISLLLFLFY